MPRLHYIKEGAGPTVVLSHALGADVGMWDDVAAELARSYTVLRYDHRGHGQSEPVPGPCTIEDLADSAADLISRTVEGEVHFVGLSMGGMVAQQIAFRHPELVNSIVVANSASHYDETARGMWRARVETVRNLGMEAVADAIVLRWFTRDFFEDPRGADRIERIRAVLLGTHAGSYAACCEAVSRIDFGSTNPRIACPALVIAGARDQSAPRAMSEAICNTISGAELAVMDTAHLSAVERPAEFAALVAGFIGRL